MLEQTQETSPFDKYLVGEYLGLGDAPPGWSYKISSLRNHQENIKKGNYSDDVAKQLYHNVIEKLKEFVDDEVFESGEVDRDYASSFYAGWEPKHFRQLLLQLGEWKH